MEFIEFVLDIEDLVVGGVRKFVIDLLEEFLFEFFWESFLIILLEILILWIWCLGIGIFLLLKWEFWFFCFVFLDWNMLSDFLISFVFLVEFCGEDIVGWCVVGWGIFYFISFVFLK